MFELNFERWISPHTHIHTRDYTAHKLWFLINFNWIDLCVRRCLWLCTIWGSPHYIYIYCAYKSLVTFSIFSDAMYTYTCVRHLSIPLEKKKRYSMYIGILYVRLYAQQLRRCCCNYYQVRFSNGTYVFRNRRRIATAQHAV